MRNGHDDKTHAVALPAFRISCSLTGASRSVGWFLGVSISVELCRLSLQHTFRCEDRMHAVQGIIETTVNDELQSDPDAMDRQGSVREADMDDTG